MLHIEISTGVCSTWTVVAHVSKYFSNQWWFYYVTTCLIHCPCLMNLSCIRTYSYEKNLIYRLQVSLSLSMLTLQCRKWGREQVLVTDDLSNTFNWSVRCSQFWNDTFLSVISIFFATSCIGVSGRAATYSITHVHNTFILHSMLRRW